MMTQRDRDALDRHITGNYGEDQFKENADDELDELEEMMDALVKNRAEQIALYRQYIASIEQSIRDLNERFDEAALSLGRRIQELRGDTFVRIPPPPTTPRPSKHRCEGLTDAERAHFQQLKARTP